MNSLSNILFKLLYHKSFRLKFIEGQDIDIGDQMRHTLSTIDKDELQSMAKQIVKNFLFTSSGYGGELYNSFPSVFKLLSHINSEDIVENFLETSYFTAYQVMPYQGKGVCLQEAFYNFLCN